MLDILGLADRLDERHEGRSLLAGGPPQMATFYTSWRNRLAGVRDQRYKYIYNLETGREELYDLRRDPGEYRQLEDPALKDRYRNYIFELTVYQRKYFEKVLNRGIDWSATQEKDEGPIVPKKNRAEDSRQRRRWRRNPGQQARTGRSLARRAVNSGIGLTGFAKSVDIFQHESEILGRTGFDRNSD